MSGIDHKFTPAVVLLRSWYKLHLSGARILTTSRATAEEYGNG
jgi:hypothetical protein